MLSRGCHASEWSGCRQIPIQSVPDSRLVGSETLKLQPNYLPCPIAWVLSGCQCATRTRPFLLRCLSSLMTYPSSLYLISSPGYGSAISYTSGGRAHGGPPVDGSLYVGNSRQMRLPFGARRFAMRNDHEGLDDGWRAQRNCIQPILVTNLLVVLLHHPPVHLCAIDSPCNHISRQSRRFQPPFPNPD
jgi:hypothetical protein